jgi:hypothetical protein
MGKSCSAPKGSRKIPGVSGHNFKASRPGWKKDEKNFFGARIAPYAEGGEARFSSNPASP